VVPSRKFHSTAFFITLVFTEMGFHCKTDKYQFFASEMVTFLISITKYIKYNFEERKAPKIRD